MSMAPRRWPRRLVITASVLALGAVAAVYVPPRAPEQPSRCFGTPSNGRLENGVALPLSGPNYAAYTDLARRLGRTYVHDRVQRVVLAAYDELATTVPDQHFVYAETGAPRGGRFRPHRTHQNGLSADFHVPVRDAEGRPAALPLHPFNRYGYDLEFDAEGRLGDLRIDFAAINAHLLALDTAARREGIGLGRVIFDPPYLARLYAADGGAEVRRRIRFMPRPAWVRHDEHYHVDFALRCEALG
ncbi:MAG: penicillin-insensitive murein endopeptidase [Silanimonas sp.]